MSKARVFFGGSSTDAIYRAEPAAAHGGDWGEWGGWWQRGRGGRGKGRAVLRWAALAVALGLLVALALYFAITESSSPSKATREGASSERGHQWASENARDATGNGADDVVSLDGDVILDLGDVTYHEGQFHRGKTGEPKGSPRGQPPREGDTNDVARANDSSRPDFIEIVPAPDLGTSATGGGTPTQPYGAPVAQPSQPAPTQPAQHEQPFSSEEPERVDQPEPSAQPEEPAQTEQPEQPQQPQQPARPEVSSEQPVEPTEPTVPSAPVDDEAFLIATSQLLEKLRVASQGTPPPSRPPPPPVAPTVPPLHPSPPPASPTNAGPLDPPPPPTPSQAYNETEGACFSPRLPLCRGVLPYDLTTLPLVPGARRLPDLDAALPYFDMVVASGCSPRARQFVCSLLEPACQPPGARPLLPCRKACKAVAEDCSDFILETLDLSRIFQCERYPDVDDATQCVNFARGDSCLRGEFRCPDGTCVPSRWRCDGVRDCAGAADERDCSACAADEYRCESDRKCVPARWRCDGQRDCDDASDETGCPPREACGGPGRFACDDGSACLPVNWRCDGLTHCLDASDERNCTGSSHHPLCPAGDFRCRHSGGCVPAAWRCNGVNDCPDNSDEDHCVAIDGVSHLATPHTSPCPVGELRCLDGRCITLQQLCDRHQDCSDGADEANCGTGV